MSRSRAHELRRALGLIADHAAHLRDGLDGPLDEAPQRRAARIVAMAVAAGELVAAGAADLVLEEAPTPGRARLDVAELVREVGAEFAPRAQAAKLTLRAVAAGPLRCWGEALALRHALANLVANALAATPAGGLVVLEATAETGEICLRVRDNGRGVPVEDRRRIFDPGVRLRDDAAGEGLGLALVRAVVARHRGRLDLEAAPEGGSIFTLALPMDLRRSSDRD